jgi:hypothetical protein
MYAVTAEYRGHRRNEQAVTLRLNRTKDQVRVGEFEVATTP